MSMNEQELVAFANSFRKLLPEHFAAAACAIGAVRPEEVLWPEEWAQARPFHPSRRHEFAAGRVAARRTLALLGRQPGALPIGPGRAPIWPPGVIGSISHAQDVALAAAGPHGRIAALGIDIERCHALSSELAALVITAADSPAADPTLLFSIKESAFKCLYSSAGRVIDYVETKVTIMEEAGAFVLSPSDQAASAFATVRGFFDTLHGYWRACCFLE